MNPIPDDRFLTQLAPAQAAACQAFMMEFIAAGESEYGWLNEYLVSPTFSAYLDYLELCAMGEYKPEIYVPQTTFFLSDPQGRLLGISRLRHRLNPSLEIEGGHIGYAVRQGSATRLLVTCDDDNTGSARTIEKNGGLLEDKRVSLHSSRLIRRYWIAL